MKSARVVNNQKQKEEAADGWTWNQKGSCYYGDGNTIPSEKIAGFDMDWTLIRTKSGATFPKSGDDWLLWDKVNVTKKIKELYDDNFKIVIFSNQGGLDSGNTKLGDIQKKIQGISKEIGVPMAAFCSSKEDAYKKPSTGMWELFAKDCNGGIKIDKKVSLYCGDAAGRKPPQVTKKDFSDSDLKFAFACGVQFFTPEQLFLGKKEAVKPSGWDPKTIKNKELFAEKDAVLKLKEQEMIVFCGSSSSGKSTFVTSHLNEYARVNRDTLKTKEKCLKVAEQALKDKQSVVIDNTCPKIEDRSLYVKLAKQYNVPVRCFYFVCEKDMCFFLNEQRVINTSRTHLSGKVPKIPIHGWFKNHEKPTTKEGFQAVQTVNFVPGPFKNEEDERQFYVFGK